MMRVGDITMKISWFLLLVAISISVHAEDTVDDSASNEDSETQISEEEKELKERLMLEEYKAKIAEQKQKIAAAEKAEREAELPTSDLEGLNGAITVKEGAGYYNTILAFDSLESTAEKIAAKVPDNKHIFITTNKQLADSAGYRELINLRLKDIDGKFDEYTSTYRDGDEVKIPLLRESLGLGSSIAAADAIIGGLGEVAKFFKTDRELHKVSVSVNEDALVASLANHLRKKCSVTFADLGFRRDGDVTTLVKKLLDRAKTVEEVKKSVKKELDSDLVALAEERSKLAKLNEKKAELEVSDPSNELPDVNRKIRLSKTRIAELSQRENIWKEAKKIEGVLAAFNNLFDELVSIPEGQQESPLQRIDLVDQIFSTPNAQILYLDVVSQGGELHTTKSTFSQGRIHYLGATVVVFFLFETDGTLVNSGMFSETNTESFKANKGIETLGEIEVPANRVKKSRKY